MSLRKTAKRPVLIALLGADADTIERCRRYADALGYQVASLGRDDAATLSTLEPDAIVIDTTRLGADGWNTARSLRATARRDRPIVALIDGELATDDRDALAARCDLHVMKPVEPDEFFSLIRRMSRSQAASAV